MPVLAVAGTKGAPGATTLALTLAGVLPGPTLYADLDPAAGDVWLRHRDPAGHPLDPDRGLLSFAASAHRGAAEIAAHVQVVSGGQPVLLGLTSPEQAAGLHAAWPHVEAALAGLAGTVVADCGRVAAVGAAPPVLRSADAVLLVSGADVASVAHLRDRVRAVLEARGGRRPVASAPPVGVVVRAAGRDRGAAAEVQRLLDSAGLPARVLGVLADDPKGAEVLTGARRGAAGRTDLVRSVRGLVAGVGDLLAAAHTAGRAAQPAAQPLAQPVAQPGPPGPQATHPAGTGAA